MRLVCLASPSPGTDRHTHTLKLNSKNILDLTPAIIRKEIIANNMEPSSEVFIIIVHICDVGVCHGIHVAIKGQLYGLGFLLACLLFETGFLLV